MHAFLRQAYRFLPAVCVLFLGAGLLSADRAAQDPTQGLRFVDLQRCFEGYAPVQSEMDRLREALNRKIQEFKGREAALKEQESELSLLDPGSEAYAEKAFGLESSRVALDRDRQFTLDRLQTQRLQLFVRSYEDVQRAAVELGGSRGYGAVLVVPPPADKLPADLQSRTEILQNRSVLWSNPTYDVTDEVLRILARDS